MLYQVIAINYIRAEKIIKYSHNIEKLKVLILRNIEQGKIKSTLSTFEKVDSKIKELINSWVC